MVKRFLDAREPAEQQKQQQQTKRLRLGQAIKADVRQSVREKIMDHLELGKNLQYIVLEMLENGTLQTDEIEDDEAMAPSSVNKYRLLERRVLLGGLCKTLPHLKDWLQSLKPNRGCVHTLFSALSGISKDSALPSKVIRRIHSEIEERTPQWAKDLPLPQPRMTVAAFLLTIPLFTLDQGAKTINHISGVQVAFPLELAVLGELQIQKDSDFHSAEVGKGTIWVKVALLFGHDLVQAPFLRLVMPHTCSPCVLPKGLEKVISAHNEIASKNPPCDEDLLDGLA